jgi:hypothetical protein
MHDAQRYRLHFRPYSTPKFRYGAKVTDLLRGKVRIVGISAGRIPWPISTAGRSRFLVLYRDLAKAVRRESNQAVAHWWGVSGQSVTKWRRALDVAGRTTAGTHWLRSAYAHEDWAVEARRKALAKARDPARRAKIAAAKRGKRRPQEVIEKVRRANLGRRPTDEARRKMSKAHRRLGTRPPKAGKPWTAREDALVRTFRAQEVARRTGRTLTAVYSRRRALGLADERTREASSTRN